MKSRARMVSLLLVLSLVLGLASVPRAPRARATVGYDVGTSTVPEALYTHNNRKIIYDGSAYYWVFYWDGTVLAYRYSSDCITWSGASSAWTKGYYGRAAGACVEYNSPYVYVITGAEAYTIYFIRGTISGTTITWGSSVRVHNSGTYYNGLGFCRLTSGRLLITYHQYSTHGHGYASDDEGVNWGAIDDGHSATITSTTGGTVLVAMTSSKAMALWKDQSNGFWYTRYASGAWGTMTQFASTTLAGGYCQFSATARGDLVYITYLDSGNIIRFRYWNDSSSAWSGIEAPYSTNAQAGACPVISVDTNTGIIYIFWAVADVIYYVTRWVDGSYSSRTTLITESVDTLTEAYVVVSYSAQVSRILVAYVAKSASPYVVRVYWIMTQSVWLTHYIAGVANSGKMYTSIGALPANVANGTVTQYGNQTTITFYGLPANGFIFNGWSGTSSSSDNPWTVVLYTNRTVYLNLGNSTLIGNATESDVKAGQTFYNNSTSAIRTGSYVPTGGTVNYLPGIVLGMISLCVVVIWFIGSKKE